MYKCQGPATFLTEDSSHDEIEFLDTGMKLRASKGEAL